MTERNDAYWDDLGVAWCAINPQIGVIAPKLKARLRRQSYLITTFLVAGFTLGGAGLLLGLFTIWSGWTPGTWNFVVRGIAIVVLSTILLFAAARLSPFRTDHAAKALSEMIDLSISRSRRTLLMIQLGFYVCAIASIFGLAGTAIRSHLSSPPKMTPIADLVILLIFALGLVAYGRSTKADLMRMRALRHALEIDGEK
jgi:hypothetical protein